MQRTAKGTWDQITYTDGIQSDYTYSSIIDENNKIWFGTYSGISVYDGQDIKTLLNMMVYLKIQSSIY